MNSPEAISRFGGTGSGIKNFEQVALTVSTTTPRCFTFRTIPISDDPSLLSFLNQFFWSLMTSNQIWLLLMASTFVLQGTEVGYESRSV
ncbi:hypothetical protein FCV25MIE_24021 [Fagus crenata]